MKKITFYIGLFTAGILLFSACTKESQMKAPFVANDGTGSYLRFIHAAPSFRAVFNQADSFNVFVNGSKVNGAFLTYASLFPASTSNNAYATVASGSGTVKFSVAGTVNADSIAIVSFPTTLGAANWYTMLITDSARILLDDSYTKPTFGNISVRFINAVMNDTAGKAVDVYSVKAAANVFTNVKPGTTPTAFVSPTLPPITFTGQLALTASITDTLIVRRAGTNIVLAQLNGQSFINQRAYTLYYRGNGNLSTGTKARGLAAYVHN